MVGSRSGLKGAALSAAARGLEFAVRPSGDYRLVRKGGRRALIELAELHGRDEFYARLEAALGLPPAAVPRVPPHITLFTEPGGGGIGLYSSADLEDLSSEAGLKLAPGPWRLDANGTILEA
ncbi:MAG: hypothetical protein Q8T11_03785 [Elusimicrobiota bacterium]|nr:hypothetical protein [Elusimicrobiota bacterium]